MSFVFSDTTGYSGILQRIERALGFSRGYITNNDERRKEWTSEVNLADDNALQIILNVEGLIQYDDHSHSKYPILTLDLVSGQKDYHFTADEEGALVLDIYRVLAADATGTFRDLTQTDQHTPLEATEYVDGLSHTGTPSSYDLIGGGVGIFLNPTPNYNYTKGLKVFVSRESVKFTDTDTNKKPSIDGRLHEWYVVDPVYRYASLKGLKQARPAEQRREELKSLMRDIYSRKNRAAPNNLSAEVEDNR